MAIPAIIGVMNRFRIRNIGFFIIKDGKTDIVIAPIIPPHNKYPIEVNRGLRYRFLSPCCSRSGQP